MKLQSYNELLHSKYRLSLMLFLVLNTAASLFYIYSKKQSKGLSGFPALIIAAFSAFLLIWMLLRPRVKFPILNVASLAIGLLWAWQIVLTFDLVFYFDNSFLLISLFSAFFIGAVALSDHLLAFCLHTLPPSMTVIVLDRGQNTLLILFTILLPLVGFTLHHILQRRRDRFTRRLVSQLYEEKQSWSDLSMLDPLTGLYNRRGLDNRLKNVFENHSGNHYILMLDIDHFKAYNDNYGHAMGDQALARVSIAIRDAVRSRDIVARYGGEEFLVLLTNVNEAIAMKLSERIRQYIQELEIPHLFNEQVATHVTVSAGFAPIVDNNFADALANADRALYVVKNRGRNAILSWEKLSHGDLAKPADAL
ncbi:GGDEF domain-containing protein [Erwinia sp. BNK-24-b]|uniref:GGDEF domain-containing protein n=1 Tax=unclassified Erwinia TaxID=2622719 RepID=UPI0039BF4088